MKRCGCVHDVRNGKIDIYRHKKPIIEVLEDSGGRRGGQWAVLCLKSFMTSAAVPLTWVTYDLWHVESYCDWSLLFWHLTTSHVLPHTWTIWQILFDICEASFVYVPCQHQSSRHFATERSGQMQMQMARWLDDRCQMPDDQMSSARWLMFWQNFFGLCEIVWRWVHMSTKSNSHQRLASVKILQYMLYHQL